MANPIITIAIPIFQSFNIDLLILTFSHENLLIICEITAIDSHFLPFDIQNE
jgi:hypothetical protein